MRFCDKCKGSGTLVLNNETTAPNAYSFSDKFGAQFQAPYNGENPCPHCLGTGKLNGFGAS